MQCFSHFETPLSTGKRSHPKQGVKGLLEQLGERQKVVLQPSSEHLANSFLHVVHVVVMMLCDDVCMCVMRCCVDGKTKKTGCAFIT